MLNVFQNKSKIISEEKENNVISSIHKTLEPFMLRRLKDDVLETYIPKKEVLVYCRISPLQKTLYKYTVDKRKKINEGFNEWEVHNEDDLKRLHYSYKI